MGVFSSQGKMKEVLPVLLVVLHQVSCDWTGTGSLSCYGHLSTDVSTPEGGGYLEQGHLDCDIIEWDGSNGLGPEAMFFKADSGSEWEVWAWDYHEWGDWPVPSATCEGDIWYKKDDMGAGYCTCTPAHCPPASPWTSLQDEALQGGVALLGVAMLALDDIIVLSLLNHDNLVNATLTSGSNGSNVQGDVITATLTGATGIDGLVM